jgi:hypothetical protein
MLHKVYYSRISKVTELRRFFQKLLGIQLSFCWMSIFGGFMFLIKPRRLTILAKLLINIIKTTNLNVNQYLTIRLSTCPRTWHYLVIKISTNFSLSCYQNVYEHGTLRLPTCQRTVHYPVIKMSTNSPLSGYQNVNKYGRKLIW